MIVPAYILYAAIAYGAIGRVAFVFKNQWRAITWAIGNLLATALLFYWIPETRSLAPGFGWYVGFVTMQFLAIKYIRMQSRFSWIALFLPVICLFLLKYLPTVPGSAGAWWSGKKMVFVGISYMAFRLSYLALEVRARSVAMPSYAEFLAYAFFLPTIVVGPISSYSTFHHSFTEFNRSPIPLGRCLNRIVVGAVKYYFFASLFNQVAFDGLLLDGNYHRRVDIVVACMAYYLFLLCNFSGFCDMVIGFAGVLGIRVDENFDNPLLARSVRDFWNRWHITLSVYMRDMFFTPLSKVLAVYGKPRFLNHAIALVTVFVFVVIGAWHGVGWHYIWFGLLHALGVVINHYYAILLKRTMGVKRFKVYCESVVVRVAAIVLTFIYVSGTFAFFANDSAKWRQIVDALR